MTILFVKNFEIYLIHILFVLEIVALKKPVDRLDCRQNIARAAKRCIEKYLPVECCKTIILEKSVGARILAQVIDSTALQKNVRLTEWVKLKFF